MGITLHYSGRFNEQASLAHLVAEVTDIAEIYGWPYYVFETTFPTVGFNADRVNNSIYGICFTPAGCETVDICFLSNGRMSSVMNLELYGNTAVKKYREYLYMLSVKTQYAGCDTHMLLVHLLKYLESRYFKNFKVIDEGYYWDSGDEKLLQETFAQYNELLKLTGNALRKHPMKPGETIQAYFDRILSLSHARAQKNLHKGR
ncbi:hypothetical protein [Foetidibacter luteolus]|uniref:hypothetical protein n=1 Tax=Foetidibacter luteolus TaxID=2608880 RepID=UPI00129B7F0B|nr:hypothetical protein [Foetidibacter luteolus]